MKGLVRYHEVHVYRLLHKWRFKPSTTKEICQYSIKRRERRVQKKTREIISCIPKDFTVAVEDESIFIHDAFRRKMVFIQKSEHSKYLLYRLNSIRFIGNLLLRSVCLAYVF